MKLYITSTSPYARVARIAVLENGLEARVEIVEAKTRTMGSPYYAINPSGRVPYLERDGQPGLEDSQLVVAYLDQLGGKSSLILPPSHADWAYGRLEANARSFTDGLSVWIRELRRPETERSPTIVAHETARAERLADVWERQIGHDVMHGPLNMAQLYLLAGLDQAAYWGVATFESTRPALRAWAEALRRHPSVAVTAPPARS